MGDARDRAPLQGCVLASNPELSEVPAESWQAAEQETRRIIWKIQPTVVSEGRRKDVVEYVQRVLRNILGLEVFPYGSVPLKTYLPDGDIDLTAFGSPNMEDSLVAKVRAVLEGEENTKDAEFEVKDVQYINAEVKLVKCLVQNIVVDISFNQIGGLCTLYFLEQVNMLIGKDNLFKHSIILIKAWCYYESRILGAHHALISTYALETLVLYIFHLFHSSLDGALAVLYKFLDYYSTFDWENYCVSLRGPVPISSLPQIMPEAPQIDNGELLLQEDFLNDSANLLPLFQRVPEISPRVFVKKHLNIVDPLKENNNLGRSVSKGNFHRIRSAFGYGARKLGRILLLPGENMKNDLRKFFANTLERHGNGDRPDVRGTCPISSERPPFHLNDVRIALTNTDAHKQMDDLEMFTLSSTEGLCGGLNEKLIESKSSVLGNTNNQRMECSTSGRGNEYYTRIPQNGRYLASGKIMGPRNPNAPLQYMDNELIKHWNPHAPPQSHEANGKIAGEDNYHNCKYKPMETDVYVNGFVSQRLDQIEPSNGRRSNSSTSSQITSISTSSSEHVISGFSPSSNDSDGGEDNICDVGKNNIDLVSANGAGDSELADLSGDPGAHHNNLLSYRQCSLGPFVSGPPSPMQLHAWDAVPQRNMFPHMNGVVTLQPFMHNFPKTKGTGLYLPNMQNPRAFRSRSFGDRGRYPFPNQPYKYRSNGPAFNPHVYRCEESERGGHGPEVPSHPACTNDQWRLPTPVPLEAPPPPSSSMQDIGATTTSQIQFGSFGPVSLGDNTQPIKLSDDNAPYNCTAASMYSQVVQKPSSPDHESSKSAQLYKLKDEEDFPPLAGRGSPSSPAPLNRHKTIWEAKRASTLS